MYTILDPEAVKVIFVNGETGADAAHFTVGMLPTMVRAALIDEIKPGSNDMVTKTKLCKYGLKAWKLLDSKGQEVKFETEESYLTGAGKVLGLSERGLNFLSVKAVNDLSAEIIKLNFVTEDAEKN